MSRLDFSLKLLDSINMSLPSSEINQGLAPSDFREGLKKVDSELIEALRNREGRARILMAERHGIISPGLGYKSYHGEDPEMPSDREETHRDEDPKGEGHINRVAQRDVEIMQTFFESYGEPKTEAEAVEREEMLVFAHYIGTIHDLVQNFKLVLMVKGGNEYVAQDTVIDINGDGWKKYIGKGKKIVRKRIVDTNENDTINEELEFMDKVNKESKKEIFTEKHKKWVREALLATIPGWNGATVYQSQLKWNKDSNNELTFATAWADLKGGIFMDGWKQFFKEGDLNLLEDNPDILEVALNPDQYTEVIEEMGDRIRVWRDDQDPFALAQWNQLEEQIILFPEAASLLRERHFRTDTYNDTYNKVKERARDNKQTKAPDLLIELRQIVIKEQQKYLRAA